MQTHEGCCAMKALRFDRFGQADVLHVAELPEPECRAGEFKVRVHAAGLNPLDWKIRAGHLARVPRFERPPRGVGVEFAGVIVGVGGGATRHFVGQRVFGALPPTGRQGSLAEFVVATGNHLAVIPEGVDFSVTPTVGFRVDIRGLTMNGMFGSGWTTRMPSSETRK